MQPGIFSRYQTDLHAPDARIELRKREEHSCDRHLVLTCPIARTHSASNSNISLILSTTLPLLAHPTPTAHARSASNSNSNRKHGPPTARVRSASVSEARQPCMDQQQIRDQKPNQRQNNAKKQTSSELLLTRQSAPAVVMLGLQPFEIVLLACVEHQHDPSLSFPNIQPTRQCRQQTVPRDTEAKDARSLCSREWVGFILKKCRSGQVRFVSFSISSCSALLSRYLRWTSTRSHT